MCKKRNDWWIWLRVSLFSLFLSGIGGTSQGLYGATKMQMLGGPSSYILAAPHDGYDLYTGKIVAELCKNLFPTWGCVIASGYRSTFTPVNVNRPTEGIRIKSKQEVRTLRAEIVYLQFLNLIQSIALSPSWYIEIHGNARVKSQQHIEIATAGVDKETAKKIKAEWMNLLLQYELSKYQILIEPLDKLHFGATSSKTCGSLFHFQPALHIELPQALRLEEREVLIRFLQAGLSQLHSGSKSVSPGWVFTPTILSTQLGSL